MVVVTSRLGGPGKPGDWPWDPPPVKDEPAPGESESGEELDKDDELTDDKSDGEKEDANADDEAKLARARRWRKRLI